MLTGKSLYASKVNDDWIFLTVFSVQNSNVLYLNERLYKFNVVTSPLCPLCKVENESVSHLFCYCRETRRLWQHLQKWFPDYGNFPHLEPQLIILGTGDDDKPDNILINHMILLFKRYIYLNLRRPKWSNLRGLKRFSKWLRSLSANSSRKR